MAEIQGETGHGDVQMRIGEGNPGFFAIASPPDPNNLGVVELLIKAVPETSSEQLAAAKPGAPAPMISLWHALVVHPLSSPGCHL